MLASYPASILNQTRDILGIPSDSLKIGNALKIVMPGLVPSSHATWRDLDTAWMPAMNAGMTTAENSGAR
jgi:hypothetical protein